MKKIFILLFIFLSVNLFSQNKEFGIKNSVYYLASEELGGRYPATKGDTLAVEFVAGVFKEFNIKPLFTTYYQEVVFKDMRSIATNSKQAGPKAEITRNVVGLIEGQTQS